MISSWLPWKPDGQSVFASSVDASGSDKSMITISPFWPKNDVESAPVKTVRPFNFRRFCSGLGWSGRSDPCSRCPAPTVQCFSRWGLFWALYLHPIDWFPICDDNFSILSCPLSPYQFALYTKPFYFYYFGTILSLLSNYYDLKFQHCRTMLHLLSFWKRRKITANTITSSLGFAWYCKNTIFFIRPFFVRVFTRIFKSPWLTMKFTLLSLGKYPHMFRS